MSKLTQTDPKIARTTMDDQTKLRHTELRDSSGSLVVAWRTTDPSFAKRHDAEDGWTDLHQNWHDYHLKRRRGFGKVESVLSSGPGEGGFWRWVTDQDEKRDQEQSCFVCDVTGAKLQIQKLDSRPSEDLEFRDNRVFFYNIRGCVSNGLPGNKCSAVAMRTLI